MDCNLLNGQAQSIGKCKCVFKHVFLVADNTSRNFPTIDSKKDILRTIYRQTII